MALPTITAPGATRDISAASATATIHERRVPEESARLGRQQIDLGSGKPITSDKTIPQRAEKFYKRINAYAESDATTCDCGSGVFM